MTTSNCRKNGISRARLMILAALVVAGCGAQPSNPVALAQSPTGLTSNPAIVSRSGCTVDLQKICQAEIDQPQIIYDTQKYDWQSFSQNAPPHTHIYFPLVLPNGHPGGTVDCYIATQQRKVLGAQMMSKPPVTEEAVEFVKSIGGCECPHFALAHHVEVTNIHGHTAPRLFWTTHIAGRRSSEVYIPRDFQMPGFLGRSRGGVTRRRRFRRGRCISFSWEIYSRPA
jgi:hypothetical protein